MPSFTRNSAAAIMSSNTFCFRSSDPALCHASPYSAPPRRLTVTNTPPSSSHAGTSARYAGRMLIEKPPYP